MSDDDSHVVSPGAFPNGLYTSAIDDFSSDTEIAKLQKENDRIKVMVRYLDSSGQRTYIINKKQQQHSRKVTTAMYIFAYNV